MNKRMKIVLSTALLTLTMSTTALAYKNPVNDLKQALIEMGIPNNYIGNVVDYLQKIKITDSQADQIMSKVKEAKALIGNTSDLSSLSGEVKSKLQSLAIQAGNIVGLNVKFGKDANGVTTMVVTTPSGGTLLQLTTLEIIDLATDFDIDVIIEAIEEAVEFSNDPNKYDLDGDGKPDNPNYNQDEDKKPGNPIFKPEGGGNLNNTATPYGNMMFAGTTMMCMAGGMHVISRKRK